MLRSRLARLKPHLAPFMVMLIASIAITCLWVLAEQDYYQGDWGRTHQMAIDQAELFRQWPGGALYHGVKESLTQDYNQLVVLPILPFVLAFGESRLVFELALVLVFQLPFALVAGAIATQLIAVRSRAVFWTTTALVLVTPAVWVPTLRGLPDMCSAFLMALAILLYLRDKSLRHWWQIPAIGCLLALAVILRRHFAYGVVALFGSWAVMSIGAFVQRRHESFREAAVSWLSTILRIGLLGVSTLAWAALLAWPFLVTVYRTDFKSLYRSYEFPPNELIAYFILIFGWGPWILAVVGYIAGILLRRLNRDVALFLLVFGLFSYVQWAYVVRVQAVHFANHFSLFVVLGLSALVWVVCQSANLRVRLVMLSSLVVYLGANAVHGMVKLTDLDSPGVGQIAASLAPNHSPIVRTNYAEIGRLVEYLRRVASPGEMIYVAAGSFNLDATLLMNAERTVYGRPRSVLTFVPSSVVDSNHDLPLSALLKVEYVVVPSTIEVQQTPEASQWEYHLTHDQQTVVKAASLAFTEPWPIAKDFARLPEEFTLSNGVTASVYRRIRPTSVETTLATFAAMATMFPSRPAGQLDWIVLEAPSAYALSKNPDGSYAFQTSVTKGDSTWEATLIYTGDVATNTRIGGIFQFRETRCASSVALNISTLSSSTGVLNTRSMTLRHPESSAFAVHVGTTGAAYLVMTLSGSVAGDPQRTCPWKLDQIRVGAG